MKKLLIAAAALPCSLLIAVAADPIKLPPASSAVTTIGQNHWEQMPESLIPAKTDVPQSLYLSNGPEPAVQIQIKKDGTLLIGVKFGAKLPENLEWSNKFAKQIAIKSVQIEQLQ